jgi:hypothetical protein
VTLTHVTFQDPPRSAAPRIAPGEIYADASIYRLCSLA